MKKAFYLVFFLILSVIEAGEAFPYPRTIILATTTSLQDSGLLEVLIPAFQEETGYLVKAIAVGSGQALAMGCRGEADVLFVHSPEEERAFMGKGYGVRRWEVMENFFYLFGPPDDPASVKKTPSMAGAFLRIAQKGALFLSRGDRSGTHAMERAIWKRAGIIPDGAKWYHETGLGMGQTLLIADEKGAYTLADSSTYTVLKKRLNIKILHEGKGEYRNVYSVIEVNPAFFKKMNAKGAGLFYQFLQSGKARKLIERFGIDKYGAPLFYVR